jgi:uncharacterized protein YjbJ (UPF0337 family)
MNDDQVKGKVKDVAGRVERQVGEWTGDKKAQADGALKQAEGKVQNAWGDVKDAAKKETHKSENDSAEPDDDAESRRKAS